MNNILLSLIDEINNVHQFQSQYLGITFKTIFEEKSQSAEVIYVWVRNFLVNI